jgi:ChrR Cupin-like domain
VVGLPGIAVAGVACAGLLTCGCDELAWMPKPELEFFDTGMLSWRAVDGDAGVSERILAEDPATGLLTRLVRWDPGVSTSAAGPVAHDYYEEVFVLTGSLHDLRLNETFGAGYYACRPPGMLHGPWESPQGCVMLELRYEHLSPGSVRAALDQ